MTTKMKLLVGVFLSVAIVWILFIIWFLTQAIDIARKALT